MRLSVLLPAVFSATFVAGRQASHKNSHGRRQAWGSSDTYPATSTDWDDDSHPETSTSWDDSATSTSWEAPATTTSSWSAVATATYGSGSSGFNGDLAGCMQSCSAQFGSLNAGSSSSYTANSTDSSTTTTSDNSTSSSASTTVHNVIVAPSQGVLKFVPFALNADVGSTVKYTWGAGPHTVTRSSALNVCNSTMDPSLAFNSGRRNASATFDVQINDTNPVWVFCGVPTHCEKGMFSVLNMASSSSSSSSSSTSPIAFAALLESLILIDQLVAEMVQIAKAFVGSDSAAWAWGDNFTFAQMDNETQLTTGKLESMLWTRMNFAANPGALINGFDPETLILAPALNSVSNSTTSVNNSTSTTSTTSASISASSSASSTSKPTSVAFRTVPNVLALGVISFVSFFAF